MSDPAAAWLHTETGTEPLRLVAPDGSLVPGARPSMTAAQVREALRLMLLSRCLDQKLTNLQRQGQVRLYAPVLGQEAAVIGPHLAIDPGRDWLVPASREQPAMLRHGWPLEAMLASYLGRSGSGVPEHVNMLPRQQSIAAQLPHAVGIGWAQAIRGLPGVVLVYCGDGATSEGDFHEACNLAGVVQAPVVFVIVNNHYAISTPVSRQTRAARLADRARGYGFPGIAVDGNDLVATYEVARHAVEHARAGRGPAMIEAVTYRLGPHNTSDNPHLYRTADEVDRAGDADPVDRLVAYATRSGAIGPAIVEAWKEQARSRVEEALARARALPAPDPEGLHSQVFAPSATTRADD